MLQGLLRGICMYGNVCLSKKGMHKSLSAEGHCHATFLQPICAASQLIDGSGKRHMVALGCAYMQV